MALLLGARPAPKPSFGVLQLLEEDGHFDRDERDACSDPADAVSTPDNAVQSADANRDGIIDLMDYYLLFECYGAPSPASDRCRCHADLNATPGSDLVDFAQFQLQFGM